ncbi:MAG TPA: TonB-dependent receptor [Gemmatirosa sp.]|nr:TonB-dependent receptor [Gemmatirosa sp.]
MLPLSLVLAVALQTQDAPVVPTDSTRRAAGDTARARALEAVTVTAVRGGDAAVARTTLDRPALLRAYTGQDVPLLLQQAPAVTTFAQSGTQWNYSYFRLRGIDQSRINMTLDGIPLNEPEDQQTYFSHFADLASSLRSVQIQRGVGTSTYGQSSFGGSVNFETLPLASTPEGAQLQLGGGSFGAARATAQWASGLRADGTAFQARFTNQRAEGYRRGASHAGNSAYVAGGWFGDRDLVKVTLLTGAESNGQAYTPVPLDVLRADPRANPIDGVGDRFRQSLAAITYTRQLSPGASLATTAYGFDAGGHYDYPTWVEGTADPRWELASRWGGVLSALRVARGASTLDAGVHALAYRRDHAFADRPDLEAPGYDNRGSKREASAFVKASRALGALTAYGDLQARGVTFRYRPTAGSPVPTSDASWTFVNPRLGLTWAARPTLRLFASVGATGREPTRADLLAGADDIAPDDADALLPLTRVRPERVRNVEAGAEWRRGALGVRGNAFAMEFRDEIALVGLTTPLGYDVRRNVGRSYRRGVELEASWQAGAALTVAGTIAASRNRIAAFRDESAGRAWRDVPQVLTPSLVAGQQVTWRAARRVSLTADGRYQSRQFLDPTGDRARTAPAFFVLDGGATLHLGRHALLVQGRNLLDRRALTAGDVSAAGVPRYFVLAPRNVELVARLLF